MVFVVDNSATSNIFENQYSQSLELVVNVVSQLDIDSGKVRVAVITFSNTPAIQFRLTTYNTKLDVTDAIGRLPFRGYTADIGTALRTLRTDLFR